MKHYTFAETFHTVHQHAIDAYAAGQREAATLFDAGQTAWLAANGISAQSLYDYAEDFHNYDGEPTYEHALAVELVRRDYFLNVQQGRPTNTVADPAAWPAKDAAIEGIRWLPRILPKARAKLRGELPASMMYGCAGDRKFFRTHDILPSEFLSLVWRADGDDQTIIDWVKARGSANS